MSRKWEKVLGIAGAVLVVVFLGGFSLTINNISMAEFQETIVPIFEDSLPNIGTEEGLQNMQTLGAWFGATVFLTLILVALGTLFVSSNKYPKRAAICYGVAGLVVLFGSQLVAYPLAFIFFVVTAMCLFRKQEERQSADA